MGIDSQLRDLEGRVERLWNALNALKAQVAANGQAVWQTTGGFGGGSTGLVRLWLPTGIAAGTFGSPGVATDAIVALASGNGWTTSGGITGQTVLNSDTTAITGAKSAWGQLRPDGSGAFDLIVGDC